MEDAKKSLPLPKVLAVVCRCGHRICDSEGVIRSRCVKVIERKAMCRCKAWVSW